MKKVAVVILNYKLKELTLRCIESVKKSSYDNLIIIVVDNNSGDKIGDELETGIIFIQNRENLGYTGGNNIGIKRGIEEEADFIFVLNPDTTVEKNTIQELVKGSERHEAGIVGPKIYFENSDRIWYAGGIFDRANVIGSHRGVDDEDKGQFDDDIETDFVTGAAMFLKREVVEKIGLFDEDYFLYYEDSDFCYRAKEKGFKVMYIPKAVVYHANAKSTGLGSPLQDYFISRNRILFANKFLSFRTQLAIFREAFRNLRNPQRRLALWDFLVWRLKGGSFIK